MLDAHLELILDSLMDLFDVLDCTDRAFPPELPRELLKLLFSNRELMVMLEALRFPNDFPMRSVLASLAFFQFTAVPTEDEVFLFFENGEDENERDEKEQSSTGKKDDDDSF